MTKRKLIKIGLMLFAVGVVTAGGVGYYMFNMPHRDVQATKVDYTTSAHDIVTEYLSNATAANEKYLDEEGESKILLVTGTVSSITEDFNGQKVVLLKLASDKAGVNGTFTKETNRHLDNVKVGDEITIKGVIRSGASYDEDLELYENVNLEKCDIANK